MLTPLAKLVSVLKPKRQWSQFSLGTMFVVVTAICIWLAAVVNRASRQREAVAALSALGAKVEYDYEFDDLGNSNADAQPPGPAWLTGLLGKDLLATIDSVDFFSDSDVTDGDLQWLWQLRGLKNVDLYTTKATLDLPYPLQTPSPARQAGGGRWSGRDSQALSSRLRRSARHDEFRG
ncbi:MAG TPA: hypothetical protein VGX78_20015 [Pirellulales bacterium]|jgi:hypothetical protein|nr:hypothetical protein [Pirellulales bacterium]